MHLKSFISTFFFPELQAFLRKFWLLAGVVLVMTLALWSIGFSEGSSEFLRQKMDSPFIKFLSVSLPYGQASNSDLMGMLDDAMGDTVNQRNFGYDDHHFVPFSFLNFQGSNQSYVRAKSRPIDPESSLYKFLFREADLMLTNQLVRLDDAPWSIVVSENLLEKLGYSLEEVPPYLNYIPRTNDRRPEIMPLPIRAVVKQLPEQTDIFFGPEAFNAITNRYQFNPFDKEKLEYSRNFRAFVHTDLNKKEMEAKIIGCFKDRSMVVEDNLENFEQGFILTTTTRDGHEQKELMKKLVNCLGQDQSVLYQTYPYSKANKGAFTPDANDYLVVGLSHLDSVAKFSEFMQANFELQVNMNDIESAKNFNLFDKVSKILSIVLTGFTISMLIYIVSKTIIEHIDRNAASLGTLKAFGLANSTITGVYFSIATIIVLLVFASGFLLALLLGSSITELAISTNLVEGLDSKVLFNLSLSYWLIGSFVLMPLAIITMLVNNKLKGKSPGDLIYGR